MSIELLERAARELAPFLGEVAFVGGATVALWITDPAAAEPRPTKDVDLVVEVASRLAWHDFEARLRAHGLRPDLSSFNGILEHAEMAAGVPKDALYPIDQDKAFGELDKIRDDTWNGRPALRVKEDPSLPVAGTFDDAMVGGGFFSIAAGAPNARAARALLRCYMQRRAQAAMCNTIAYCLDMPGIAARSIIARQEGPHSAVAEMTEVKTVVLHGAG